MHVEDLSISELQLCSIQISMCNKLAIACAMHVVSLHMTIKVGSVTL